MNSYPAAARESKTRARAASVGKGEIAADTLLSSGRTVFGLSLGMFGLQHLIYANSSAILFATPPFTASSSLTACLIGGGLIVASFALLTGKKAWHCCLALGTALFVDFLVVHMPRMINHPQSGVLRTRAFETLAIAGTALIAAASFGERLTSRQVRFNLNVVPWAGRVLMALSLIIFGVQHFMYLNFVASLIPSWIPWHRFWTAFTGFGFIAAGLSIATGKAARLAGILLATMFLIWVVVLHAPRVVRVIHSANEWSSMIVAVAMCGMGLLVAGEFPSRRDKGRVP